MIDSYRIAQNTEKLTSQNFFQHNSSDPSITYTAAGSTEAGSSSTFNVPFSPLLFEVNHDSHLKPHLLRTFRVNSYGKYGQFSRTFTVPYRKVLQYDYNEPMTVGRNIAVAITPVSAPLQQIDMHDGTTHADDRRAATTFAGYVQMASQFTYRDM